MLKVFYMRIVYLFLAVFLLNISNAYSAQQVDKKLDINKATVKELVKVKGIGKAKAEAIVKFVKKESIKTMDDLLKVQGIGKKVLNNLKEKFEVKKQSKPTPKKQNKKK